MKNIPKAQWAQKPQRVQEIQRTRKTVRFFLPALLFYILVVCFAGCGGGAKGTSSMEDAAGTSSYAGNGGSADLYLTDMEEPAEAVAEEGKPEAEGDAGESLAGTSERKLVKTVSMVVETEEFDALVQKVEARVESLGGYIENLNVYNGSYYQTSLKNADMVLRIPQEKLAGFVTAVEEISNVKNRQESTEDITLRYVDAESHKEALITEKERLMALLSEAESMEDIIALEQRLSQVRYELESMESQLRTYDNQVDYATVTLKIEEVEVLTPTQEVSAWEKMSTGFMNSVRNIGKGLKNFCIGLVICLPYLLLWGVLILLAFLVARFFVKRSGKKEKPKVPGKYAAYNSGKPGGYYGAAPWTQQKQPPQEAQKQPEAHKQPEAQTQPPQATENASNTQPPQSMDKEKGEKIE